MSRSESEPGTPQADAVPGDAVFAGAAAPTAQRSVALAVRHDTVVRSLRVAAVVGSLLVALNYGDKALSGTLQVRDFLKMALTYLVPYGVATYATVQALRERR